MKQAKRAKHRCNMCYEFRPHIHLERLRELRKRKKPVGVFNSMGDPFDYIYGTYFLQEILGIFGNECSQHWIYLLTKQAELRLYQLDFPSNVRLGVSVNKQCDVDRIKELQKSNAEIKFVSFEPLYEKLVIPSLEGIDQIIIGAETSHGKTSFMPEMSWVRELMDVAHDYHCKIFLKNNLNPNNVFPILQEIP